MALIDEALQVDAATAHYASPSSSFDPLSEHTPHVSAREITTPEQLRALAASAALLAAATILASQFLVTTLALLGGAIIVAMIALRYAAALAP